jgi:uncharacterized damage-inducible protein DinB
MSQGDPIDDLLQRLAGIPARINQVVAGLAEADLHQPPAPGEWSIADILAHLRASDDILAPRILMMLVRDNPPLASFDDRRWMEVTGYAQSDIRGLLQVYALRRTELVNILRRQSPADWERSGTHEERGKLTVLEVVKHLVEHEEEHCAQMEALRGKS